MEGVWAGHKLVGRLMQKMQEAQAAVEYAVRTQQEQHECLREHVKQVEADVKDKQEQALEAARQAAIVLQQVWLTGP